MTITRLTKPVTRVVGTLVVTIDAEGLSIRGLRKRSRVKCKRLTWEQVASLDGDATSVCRVAEQNAGTRELKTMDAILAPSDAEETAAASEAGG